jgi:hypothetical protein
MHRELLQMKHAVRRWEVNMISRVSRPVHGLGVRVAAFFIVLQLLPNIASAKHQSSGSQASRSAAEMQKLYADHKSDFDYLLGDWEFNGTNKIYGKLHGFWSAVRLEPGGQILDEYRIVGDKGETEYSTSTIREYNPALARWELISMESSDGLQNFGTGNLDKGEMHIEQKFGAMSPKPTLLRIRYHDIQPNHFLWNADRSTDNGKTWQTDYMQLDVHRIGPSRSIGPLIKGKGANARD